MFPVLFTLFMGSKAVPTTGGGGVQLRTLKTQKSILPSFGWKKSKQKTPLLSYIVFQHLSFPNRIARNVGNSCTPYMIFSFLFWSTAVGVCSRREQVGKLCLVDECNPNVTNQNFLRIFESLVHLGY